MEVKSTYRLTCWHKSLGGNGAQETRWGSKESRSQGPRLQWWVCQRNQVLLGPDIKTTNGRQGQRYIGPRIQRTKGYFTRLLSVGSKSWCQLCGDHLYLFSFFLLWQVQNVLITPACFLQSGICIKLLTPSIFNHAATIADIDGKAMFHSGLSGNDCWGEFNLDWNIRCYIIVGFQTYPRV